MLRYAGSRRARIARCTFEDRKKMVVMPLPFVSAGADLGWVLDGGRAVNKFETSGCTSHGIKFVNNSFKSNSEQRHGCRLSVVLRVSIPHKFNGRSTDLDLRVQHNQHPPDGISWSSHFPFFVNTKKRQLGVESSYEVSVWARIGIFVAGKYLGLGKGCLVHILYVLFKLYPKRLMGES